MVYADQALPLRFRPEVFLPESGSRHSGHWRINGHGATIYVWTAEEWAGLPVRPHDAQYYPCGVWCALRLDD